MYSALFCEFQMQLGQRLDVLKLITENIAKQPSVVTVIHTFAVLNAKGHSRYISEK